MFHIWDSQVFFHFENGNAKTPNVIVAGFTSSVFQQANCEDPKGIFQEISGWASEIRKPIWNYEGIYER